MVKHGVKQEQQGELFLPPGFKFHPTDEEVITSYLLQKFLNPSFNPRAIGEVNLNKCEPWDLPTKAKMVGEKDEWYFFCHKDMKYPTGTRTNRATKEGYWKATGKDREIFKPPASSASRGGRRELVGMKKTLVFYMGRAPRGSKTNWVMHEFRLEGSNNANLQQQHRLTRSKDEWVVCKVFHKNSNKGEAGKAKNATAAGVDQSSSASIGTPPNVSSISVDAGAGDDDDFIDSMIDSMVYLDSITSLPDLTTMNAAATTASSFVDLPCYHTFVSVDTTTSRSNQLNQQPAVVGTTSSTVTPAASSGSYSSSWNLPHAGHHPMGSSYNLHDQAMMARAPADFASPDFAAAGLPTN